MIEESPAEEPTAVRPPEETPTVVAGDPAAPLQLTPGTILGDRYRVVSLIGRGGMGEVYRADDLKLGQTVALKFLSRHGDAQRLYEEVRIGRQVSHPNVCRLHDIAEVDAHLFITMEFVDGEDVASLLRRVGRLPSEKALAVTRDICAGVAAAHEKGVIHRDLKPANVMIDGRGRARVTDFGLAVAGAAATDSAGTPAYMAPEQLAGESASIKSDIYALGLVIYEVFTGRRAFEASSTHDLLMRQQRGDFTRPSLVTKDIPPAVERVISRCLDPDPGARPNSVEQIALELPGGDPLAAAIAAGETPSPAMVAAAAKTGDLSGPLAWAMFAIALSGFVLTAQLSPRTLLRNAAGMKSPDVLQEIARKILVDAGLPARRGDSDLFTKSEPVVGRITAVYRESRFALHPFNATGVLRLSDPPLDFLKGGAGRNEGMANVELDGDGRLLRFTIVPPAMEKAPDAPKPSWDVFLAAAGFDPRTLVRTEPLWAARVDTDAKAAWLARDGKRIEAASYHGRPVWFEVISRDYARYATSPPSPPRYLPERLAYAMTIIFLIAIPTAAVLMARANLRRHQGDRAGARRVAMFFLVTIVLSFGFEAHHSLRFVNEWAVASYHVALGTFWAFIAALGYIALEPFVRKHWPQILISWTRLLAGRFTDPMVGRDILMGAAGAALVVMLWQATLLIAGVDGFFTQPSALGPVRFVVAAILNALAEAVGRGVGLVILLVILRAFIPKDAAAAILTIVLIATMTLGDTYGPPWLRATYALIAAYTGVLLARYLGLLAVISYAFILLVQQRVPFTFDSDSWLFGRSMMVMLLFAVFLAYAFRIAVGHRRWLPHVAFE